MDPRPRLTFAGIDLVVPPDNYPQVSVRVDDLFQRPLAASPTTMEEAWYVNHRDFTRSLIEVGSLVWPTGASRWAIGLFLATSEQLEGIASASRLNGEGSHGIRKVTSDLETLRGRLEMCTGTGADAPVLSVDMWMLPPIPVHQVPTQETENTFNYPLKHLNGLWVIPLVDDRYFWWQKTIYTAKVPLCSTWAETLTGILEAGKIPAGTIEETPMAYGPCPEIFRNVTNETRTPLLLDVMTAAINRKITLGYDGKVRAPSAKFSESENARQFEKYKGLVVLGGALNVNKTLTMQYNDVGLLLPEFIDYSTGSVTLKVKVVDLPDYKRSMLFRKGETVLFSGEVGAIGKKTGRCAVFAPYSGISDSDYDAEMVEAFKKTHANDWLILQKAAYHVTLAGIVPWETNSCVDSVTFRFTEKTATTEIRRPPFSQFTNFFMLDTLLGSTCSGDMIPCGQCKGMNQGHVNGAAMVVRQLKWHPEGTQATPPNSSIGLPVGNETYMQVTEKWPNWTPPPYVLKFCLGKATGNVSLDFDTWETARIAVYWNGKKVGERSPTGRGIKMQTCSSCGPAVGRITFNKDRKYPSTAVVIVDSDYFAYGGADFGMPYNREHPAWTRFVVNMRCVDNAPDPAPKCLACDAKMISLPSGFSSLSEFLVGSSLATQGAQGGLPIKTPVCGTNATPFEASICGANLCVIPPTVTFTYDRVPAELKSWQGGTFEMTINSAVGGYTGIVEHPDGTMEYYNLRVGYGGMFQLRLKTLFGSLLVAGGPYTREDYFATNIRTCSCSPFILRAYSPSLYPNAPGSFEISIKEIA